MKKTLFSKKALLAAIACTNFYAATPHQVWAEEVDWRVCEKISVSLIFYDKFLGWRMPQSFSGNHPALAAL